MKTLALPVCPPMHQRPCTHFDDRPHAEEVSLLVIHNISLPAGNFATAPQQGCPVDSLFCGTLDCSIDPSFSSLQEVRVAAHCVIWRDGTIFQYVPFANRAWHAGKSEFAGRANCNDFSIGIELEGSDDLPYTEQQYQSLIALSHYLLARYKDITPERVVGHCDIAPGRKTDPGPAFDWPYYRAAILAAIKESRE
ncbi:MULTISPECIES: 1,6-anhydro-N-acetylmuramyl-L-alanine amidase AmpD [unclassified Arsukibacterium]|uniref:1,6-anhydro-N-acetylmuramyl-L-alanine amidase AmpD n=1 Tax=unclassified Arsukibacterium TaxID=2635278 RepID=UPI000C57035B|nr:MULTISPECIES: 1,6-anhydro-N-acetylmuramyl-L-alanine amidase AmpD [unclassified Arsukibacterium]MAA94321.1 1,6-anhydro-N-acetylmuramyl-L-alanine amidase AmpD [Rheinheimera sp.]MBM34908.1 1,6-anhydro-N-acetylmuramyl-L-alanine amidase AmpD [Rheinheimera sp.]HAW94576.1 1,6-anhydro-N-acetylmuramyl-L-alanine amidase AmpD [Candidatus Azambacteria bacterium]